jgi:Arc/MetJ-type ribon-helix-helix transcriptional regulator
MPSGTPALKAMEVRFTPDPEALIREAVASRRYRTAEDAVRDAMARWEEDERSRLELRSASEEGEADLDAGRFDDYTDNSLSQSAVELRREGGEARSRDSEDSEAAADRFIALLIRHFRMLGRNPHAGRRRII